MSNESDNAKPNKRLINGIGTVGHIARNNLERIGSVLDGINAKSNKASKFTAVDLSGYKKGGADNIFSQQTLRASQQLLGNRFATYGKYAKKVVPDSVFQKITDGAFAQLAKLAATWSEIDLPNEHRFDGIQGLDDQERNALAKDIANQNRALATMGGVTGLAGLPGMLADTLWLLLVSLRTVYQLATVYDKPLTGKQGVKMAYAVLSHADLSKMQEKQAILAGLGVAKGLLDNADNQGLRSELKNIGVQNSNANYYAEQVEKIAEQFNIDIDGMDLSWLLKIMPVAAVAVGTYYNNHLIDEVIGVANATFGPEPITAKQALTDESNKTSTLNAKHEDLTGDQKGREESDASDSDSEDAKDIQSAEVKTSDSNNDKQNVNESAQTSSSEQS